MRRLNKRLCSYTPRSTSFPFIVPHTFCPFSIPFILCRRWQWTALKWSMSVHRKTTLGSLFVLECGELGCDSTEYIIDIDQDEATNSSLTLCLHVLYPYVAIYMWREHPKQGTTQHETGDGSRISVSRGRLPSPMRNNCIDRWEVWRRQARDGRRRRYASLVSVSQNIPSVNVVVSHWRRESRIHLPSRVE